MAGKAEKTAKTSFRQRWGQLWMAFTFTKKHDKWLIPILLAAFVVTAGLSVLLAWWAAGPWWGDYMFSIEPDAGGEKPQIAWLTPFVD